MTDTVDSTATEAQAEKPAKTPTPGQLKHRKRINYALAGALLHAGVNGEEIALRVGASNWNSLRAGMARKGVTKRVTSSVTLADSAVTSVTQRVAVGAAEMIRDSIGERLASQIATLTSRKVGRLANYGQGEAAVLKTLAETHKTLYGGAEMNVLVFGVDSMNGTPVQQLPQAAEQNSQGVIDVGSGE